MTLESLLPLALFVVVATISPGGATALATASGARFGFLHSIPLIGGIAIGIASLAATAAAGFATLLIAMPGLQTAMKAIGTVYLLYLAWKIANAGAPTGRSDGSKPISLLGGAGLLWLNPKGWAMTFSAAASFSSLANGPLQLSVLLGAAFALAASVSLALWCAAGMLLGRILKTPVHWRILNTAMACLLILSIIPMWE